MGARHLDIVVRRANCLGRETGVGHVDQVPVSVVGRTSERVEAVEVMVGPTVPEVVAVEDGVDHRRNSAAGHLTVGPEHRAGRRQVAQVCRVRRIGVDAHKVRRCNALRPTPIVRTDAPGSTAGRDIDQPGELAGSGHTQGVEDAIRTRVDGVE